MSPQDARKRLKQCRDLQPNQMQIIVAADIVDALLGCPGCDDTDPGVVHLTGAAAKRTEEIVKRRKGTTDA